MNTFKQGVLYLGIFTRFYACQSTPSVDQRDIMDYPAYSTPLHEEVPLPSPKRSTVPVDYRLFLTGREDLRQNIEECLQRAIEPAGEHGIHINRRSFHFLYEGCARDTLLEDRK